MAGTKSKTKFTSQHIDNVSFDEVFEMAGREIWAYDSVNGELKRVTLDALGHYGTNDVEKISNALFYEGLEDADGGWQVVKTTTVGGLTSNRFATELNNAAVTSYSAAWTARATLVYGIYGTAF